MAGEDPKTAATSDKTLGEKFKGTFADMLKKGQNYSCTFSTTDTEGNTSKGTMYVASAGKLIYSTFEFNPKSGDTNYAGSMIRDEKYNYIWTAKDKQGFKTPIDLENDSLFAKPEATDKSTENQVNFGVDDTSEVDFDCKPWAVDKSMFVPPSDIEFMDLSEQMKQAQEAMQNAPKLDCSVCDQIPAGDSRTQCQKAMGC